GAALDGGEGEAAEIGGGDALAVGGLVGLVLLGRLEAEDHRGLAVGEGAQRLRPLGAEIAGLERLELAKRLQLLAGLEEGLGLEAVAFIGLGGVEGVLAAIPHGEVAPVEVDRPLFAAAARDRDDAGILELLHGREEVVP